MRRISLALAALVSIGFASVGLAACGGGSGDAADDTTTTAGAPAETTTTAGDLLTEEINETAWFAGFKVTIESGTFTTSPSYLVELDTMFENLGSDAARFDGQLVLDTQGNGITSTDLTDIPEVPGGKTGKGTMRFNVGPGFVFDDAILTIGSTEHNQAIVPLGFEGELVSLEPVTVPVTGKATAGQLVITTHGGELRADIPETHGEVDAGQLALTIDFDATNNGTGGGGYAFVDDNLALELPDGTTVAPDDAPIELLGHRATTKNLSVRFLVDDPAAGAYFLVLREGETEGKLKFTIAAPTTTTGAATSTT
jgi:hypothetical protein